MDKKAVSLVIRRQVTTAMAVVVVVLGFGCDFIQEQQVKSRRIVVLLDLSRSTPPEEHRQNKKFIGELINFLESGDEVFVIGITNASFRDVRVILSANMPIDHDPLKPKVLTARERLIALWQARNDSVVCWSDSTDILGAVSYAELLFRDLAPGVEKWLIVESDLRHSIGSLNLEQLDVIPSKQCLLDLRKAEAIPQLPRVKVALLGAHTSGENISRAYYESLQQFWRGFFDAAGAHVIVFRPDRSWQPFVI